MSQSASDDLQKELQFDEINKKYFERLTHLRKKNLKREKLVIGENIFFTLTGVPVRAYHDLKSKEATYLKQAQQSSLWLKKAQGGGGTSIKRKAYLQKLNKPDSIGAKGTDLFVGLGQKAGDLVSLGELQVLQAVESLSSNEFGEIFYDDLVGLDSRASIQEMWKKKFWIDQTLTYQNLNKKYESFHRFKETVQASLPTLNSQGEFTLKRVAPGGHAFFAFEALLSAVDKKLPPAKFKNLVSVIGNGEDLGSTPDGVIIGWVIEEKIPITVITTEKTEIDLKGGQIATQRTSDGKTTVTIVEQAQARESGQLEIFEKNRGLFNTNTAILNYNVLVPKLNLLREKLGTEAFETAITPSLIINKKTQRENDGENHTYEQLEGAMGSTLLNLDATYRLTFNEPLVYFVKVERKNRTRFFSPVKTAFDFFMLYHSDRFSLNLKSFKLVDHRPGALPLIHLPQSYYEEVQNVLDAFEDTRILDLDYLAIDAAPVILKDLVLVGRIAITNLTDGLFDLGSALKQKGLKQLRNQSVRITPQRELIIS